MKQRRGISRFVIRVSIFLLLGAIVNIAMAWGFAALVDLRDAPEQFNVTHDPGSGSWIADTRRDGFGFSQSIRRELRPKTYGVTGDSYILEFETEASPTIVLAPGETIENDGRLRYQAARPTGPQSFMILEPWTNSYGWPCRSMCCWLENQRGYPSSGAAAHRGIVRVVAGIDLSQGRQGVDRRALPLQPIWFGLLLNTIVYAAMLWLLFAALQALRRMRRIKRGLCPACAYPVGTSDLCTECGKPVKPRTEVEQSSANAATFS